MTLCILTSALLSQTLMAGLSYTLNVTVFPSPWALHPRGENASIWCSVSQRRKPNSLLTVRWIFSSGPGEEQTIGRITKYGNIHLSGNWSQKGDLSNESPGKGYRLMLIDLNPSDQGIYTCRVQEVARHQSRWSAVSNGTAGTRLKDLYMYAVLICCVGIFSLLTFLLILLCQTIFHKRRSKVRWKCSPERLCDKSPCVTDLLSHEPTKKKKRKKNHEEESPPALPVKGPLVSLAKNSQQLFLLPKLVEEGLTYAELEIIKPIPPVKDSTSSTVYAQILFEENSLQLQIPPAKE
ncbi:V-set and transmembrane domain-containing protein 4 isoform X2 [Pseudophryne corroboree]|uniref:V-set and transmembrane domain-containing protein 4 isoform X2 n=1 Tax=Pseudophryne corroboree TaxID=495146 RepID=UPI0030816505